MNDREHKLKKLQYQQTAKNMQVSMNGEAFLDTVDKIEELKNMLGDGVELSNIDKLVDELQEINSLKPFVNDLKDSIVKAVTAIPNIPDNIEVKGLADLIKLTEQLSKRKDPEPLDTKPFQSISKNLKALIEKVENLKVPPTSQRPEDYTPMRRVVRVEGVGFLFDDSFYTGGGGGGGGSSSGGSISSAQLPTALSASGSDAQSNTSDRLATEDRLYLYNGTTWDRARSGQTGAQSSFTGFQNMISMGRYNATPLTLTDGQGAAIQFNSAASTRVTEADLLAGENLTYNKLEVMPKYTYSAVAVADVQIKSGPGILHSVTISCNDQAPTAGTIIIYDNTAESGTVVFNFNIGTTFFFPFTVPLDYNMLTGIYCGFTTTADVNVSMAFL